MGLFSLWHKYKLYQLYKKAREHPELLKDVKFLTELFKTALEIKEIREMLKGIKSYLVAGLAAAVTVAHMLGYIDEAMFQSLMALLGAGAVTTVAAKLNRAAAQNQQNFDTLNKK